MLGLAWLARLGELSQGLLCYVGAGRGWQGLASYVEAGPGLAWLGRVWLARLGWVRRGMVSCVVARRGSARLAWSGLAGMLRSGEAWRGQEWLALAGEVRSVGARRGPVWPGPARRRKAGLVCQVVSRPGLAGFVKSV